MKKGNLFVISGPSGVGKDTIIEELLKEDENIWLSISMTTREKRDHEEDKVHYYFVTKEEFQKHIELENLLEYEEVYHDIFYGTPKDKVIEKLEAGKNVILKIDVKGGINVKKAFNEATLIMLVPPTLEELKKRLTKRNTEDQAKQQERLERANLELSYQDKYDYVVVNDDIKDATKRVLEIIKSK